MSVLDSPLPLPGPKLGLARNPFRGSVLNDAWSNPNLQADVQNIHQAVFQTCCEAVEFVRDSGSSAGVAIFGEPGSGKTHLIGRLRRRLTDTTVDASYEKLSQAFAYVRLSVNPSSLYRHVRKRVAEDLLKGTQQQPCQLERLVLAQLMEQEHGGGNFREWWDHLLDERNAEVDELVAALGSRIGLSPTFCRVLSHLVLKRHRHDVSAWLRGESISEAGYQALAIGEAPDDDPEQVSKDVLRDFMRLAGPQVPLVICFDQVEALQVTSNDTASLFQFGQLVSELHDADTNVVLISCMQASLFAGVGRHLPEYAATRLSGYAAKSLNPLTLDNARDLLVHRLRACGAFSVQTEANSPLAPLSEADLKKFLGPQGCTPRALLDSAARFWDALQRQPVTREDTNQWLEREWDRRADEATRTNTPNQTAEILRHGVPHLVQLVDPHWKLNAAAHGSAIDYVLTGPEQEARVGLKFCEAVHNALTSQLKRLDQEYPGDLKLQKLLLLRDERNPIGATAKVAHKHLKSLEQKDADLYRVPTEALAALDALRQLIADAQAGDLDYEGTTVEFDTVVGWLRNNLPDVLKEMSDLLITQAAPPPESSLIDRLQELLLAQRVVAAPGMAAALNVSLAELLAVAERRPELFGLIRGADTNGSDAVLFSARAGGGCLAAIPSS